MAAVALEDVVKQLQLNKKSTDDVMKTLKEWLQMQKNAVLDNLEKEREQKATDKKNAKTASGGGGGKGNTRVNFWGNLLNPKFWMKGLIAIPAALTALVAGLAGWRIGWFKALKGSLKALMFVVKMLTPKFLLKPIMLLRNAIFRMFGLRVRGGRGGWAYKGIQGLQKQSGVFVQIITKFRGFMNLLMKGFGGKKGFKFPKGFRTVFKVFGGFLRIVFGTVKAVGSGIGRILKPFMGFLRFGGRLFMGVFKKILWPIGIIMGLFAGVKSFMNSSESGILGKLGDFMGGFMADFIGMPLKLLRDIVGWIVKKIFPGSVNADGSFDTGSKFGAFMQSFMDFPIMDTIKAFYKAPFKALEAVIGWVKMLFTDPLGAIKVLWKGIRRTFKMGADSAWPIIDFLMIPVNGIIKWIAGVFGWDKEQMQDFKLQDVIANAIGKVILEFKKFGPGLLFDVKNRWARAMAIFQKSWIRFGGFFAKIPEYALLVAQNTIFGPIGRAGREKKWKELSERETPGQTGEIQLVNDALERDLTNNLRTLKQAWANVGESIMFNGEDGPDPFARQQRIVATNNTNIFNRISLQQPGDLNVYDPINAGIDIHQQPTEVVGKVHQWKD
jgi:hypothetical protein